MRPTSPEMLEEARKLVRVKPSTSYIQRKLEIGYNHACEIMEHFEAEGLISKRDSSGLRSVLIQKMSDDELTEAHFAICNEIDHFHRLPDEDKEHGGSPGEWMFERLDEIETEQRRRLRS